MAPDDIEQEKDFLRAIAIQQQLVFRRLETDLTGSDELSALIKCAINRLLFKQVDITPSLSKWIICYNWASGLVNPGKLVELHTMLTPYSTSMDAALPEENIVMLVKQHLVPGCNIARWTALQDEARFAHLANDPVLACRLNAAHAVLARKPGAYKGQFSIGPEFFDPLPDDELAAWEGESIGN